MHLHLLLLSILLVESTTSAPYDLDMFTPDLDFNPILLDGLQPDAPLDDHIFTLPESSGEIYTTDLNEGNQIPLDETYSSNIHTGNTEPFLDTFKESFDDIFNVESNSPDMTNLALLDPELQPLIHAPDCKKFKSILCCNPKTEFIPAAVDECIWFDPDLPGKCAWDNLYCCQWFWEERDSGYSCDKRFPNPSNDIAD